MKDHNNKFGCEIKERELSQKLRYRTEIHWNIKT